MPQPTTTGGSLMSYASTVDTGQIAPFTLETPDITVLSTAVSLQAGSAYFSPVLLYASVTVTQMRCNFSAASPTGNCDMGIYDATGTNGAPGNLLGHTGAIAAATGNFTKSLTANLTLSPGQYWLAFIDTVGTDNPCLRASIVAGLGALYRTTATNLTVLPATTGAVSDTATRVGVMALLLNSFS